VKSGEEFRRGWRVLVAAGVGTGTGIGLLVYVNGFFLKHLQGEFGWTRAEISAMSLLGLGSAFVNPVVGRLVDRFGVRPVVLAAFPLFCLGFVGFALMPGYLWALYTCAAWFALVGPCVGPVSYTKVINEWFEKSRGLALGLGLSGISIVTVVLFPVLYQVLETFGWRAGYAFVGGFCLILGMPTLVAWLRDRQAAPSAEAARASYAERSAEPSVFRRPAFWALAVAMLVANVGVGGFVHHLQPLLTDAGVPGATAALIGSWYVVAVAGGRIGAGFLLDRLWAPGVAAVAMALPAAGALLLINTTQDLGPIIIAVGLIGFAQGAEFDLIAFFTPRHFGLRRYSSTFGLLMMFAAISGAIGTVLFGRVFDMRGDYDLAVMVSAVGFAIAALCFFSLAKANRAAPDPLPVGP